MVTEQPFFEYSRGTRISKCSKIGSGGFGSVFKATLPGLSDSIAVKTIDITKKYKTIMSENKLSKMNEIFGMLLGGTLYEAVVHKNLKHDHLLESKESWIQLANLRKGSFYTLLTLNSSKQIFHFCLKFLKNGLLSIF